MASNVLGWTLSKHKDKIVLNILNRFKGCDSYDPDYLGEDDKPEREDEFDGTAWDDDESNFDTSVDLDDTEFIRHNQVLYHNQSI